MILQMLMKSLGDSKETDHSNNNNSPEITHSKLNRVTGNPTHHLISLRALLANFVFAPTNGDASIALPGARNAEHAVLKTISLGAKSAKRIKTFVLSTYLTTVMKMREMTMM